MLYHLFFFCVCLEESLLIVSCSSKMCWGFDNEFLIYVIIAVV